MTTHPEALVISSNPTHTLYRLAVMGKVPDYQLISNQMPNDDESGYSDIAVETAKPQLKSPSFYQVVVLNDDYTPMDFVVEVLEQFFAMTIEQATQVMLDIHHKGQAVAGVYPKDIAETKAQQVSEFARANEHPLLCRVEKKPD